MYIIIRYRLEKDEDTDRKMMIEDEIEDMIGPFKTKETATKYLKRHMYKFGDGMFVATRGDRPGDACDLWWHRSHAADIMKLKSPRG